MGIEYFHTFFFYLYGTINYQNVNCKSLNRKIDMTLVDRFLKYVSFDTQSDESTGLTPSTPKQKSDLDKSIIANIALEQCMEGMKAQKKPQLVIPRDLKDYVAKYSKGPVYKEMKKKLRNQDYEKLQIGSIWMVFAIAMVLFFLKNLLTARPTGRCLTKAAALPTN